MSVSSPTLPPWLSEVVACPMDGGALIADGDGYSCQECGRGYPMADGALELLPDHLAHFGVSDKARAAAGEAAPSDERELEWVSGEMEWWGSWHERDSGRPLRPDAGLRGRSRERQLLRHVRDRVGPGAVVVEMGAGAGRTMAGLWPPAAAGLRYVATDLSRAGLRAGAQGRGDLGAAVQCEAGRWPFAEASVDVVLILGVLHHLPDWRLALARACESVRPGGFVALHEVIYKPRIFANRRAAGINDAWTSPHEGHVSREELLAQLESHGSVLRWREESTPLRFALVQYLDLHERLEDSRVLTVGLDLADQAFGRTLGRLRPSMGFAEATCVLQRA